MGADGVHHLPSRMGPVWVTGAGGLIGHHLVQAAAMRAPNLTVIPLTRHDLDLTDFNSVRERFQREQPITVIHCAALSRSPECQANPALAWKLNVEVTKVLADLAARAYFIFFSSDLVFDGRAGNYDESAPVSPLSVYAETKVAAERIVLGNPRHLVVRTSLNGGPSPTGDRGFNEQLRRSWAAGQMTNLFTDEFRCPIHVTVTARAVWELALKGAVGLYHLAGSERLSRWQMGQLVAARCPELNPRLQPGSIKDYAGAPRPGDTSLNCAKAQKLLSFPLPGLTEWLSARLDEPF